MDGNVIYQEAKNRAQLLSPPGIYITAPGGNYVDGTGDVNSLVVFSRSDPPLQLLRIPGFQPLPIKFLVLDLRATPLDWELSVSSMTQTVQKICRN